MRESPREVRTHGTFVPMTIAANSAPPKCVTALKKTLADSMFGKSRQSGSPATVEPCTFLCSATSLYNATSSDSGPSMTARPNCPRSPILASMAASVEEGTLGRTCSDGAMQAIFGVSMPSSLAVWYSITAASCRVMGRAA